MVRIRREVRSLGAGWPETLLWYAEGVRAMQSRPLADPTSWWFFAAMHGISGQWVDFEIVDATTVLPEASVRDRFWRQCQHQSWYFLPWHRGYISAFEQVVRAAVVDAGGPDDWALPYWNYSDETRPDARNLPEAFDEDTLPDGSDNPLKVARRFGDGSGSIVIPADIVSLDAALEEDDFIGGDNPILSGFGGPVTLFNHSGGTNGLIESMPHNWVHGAIGGDGGLMSYPTTAGLDPIFWLHHANIDRLWTVWRRDNDNPVDPAWLDGPVARRFVAPRIPDAQDASTEWQYTARAVLDTTASPLGYVYDDDVPPAPPQPAAQRRRTRRIGMFAAAGAGAGGPADDAAEEGADMNADRTPELVGASEGAVRVAGDTDAAVRLDADRAKDLRRSLRRRPSGFGIADAAEPPRVFLKLEGITGSNDAANYYVYVGPPKPARAEGADEGAAPHALDGGASGGAAERPAGTVSLFGVSDASDPDGPSAGAGISQVIEISDVVDALHLAGDDLSALDVRFVPANESVAAMDFSIARVSVYVLPT